MKQAFVVVGMLLVALSFPTCGVGLGGSVWVGTVTMEAVNAIIESYNAANGADVPALDRAFGGEAEASLAVGFFAIPYVGLRGAGVSAQTARERVSASILGPYAGLAAELGRAWMSLDVGAYRGAFSFPAARYDGLEGWGIGVVGRAGYALPISSVLAAYASVSATWLPVSELRDAEGAVYGARTGAFLDFSGFSLSLGMRWGR